MPRNVLDVGNCPPDHAAMRALLEGHFDARIVQAHGPEDTIDHLRSGQFDLVLINRKLDRDYSDGLEVLRQIKADPHLAATPVMLITNYSEHQQQAVEYGAELGFGKNDLDKPETRERLEPFLG